MSGDPFWHAIRAQGLEMPPVVDGFHAGQGEKRYCGQASITRGRNPLVRLALWLAGMPRAGADVPVRMRLVIGPEGADWVRDFGGHTTRSRLSLTRDGHVVERFGPFRIAMAVRAERGGLRMDIAGMRAFGVPVPGALRPVSQTREYVGEDGRFRFDVGAAVPGLGPVIRYAGWLEQEP